MLLYRGILHVAFCVGMRCLGTPFSRLLHPARIAQNTAPTRGFMFMCDAHYVGVS